MQELIRFAFAFITFCVLAELGYLLGDIRKYIQTKTKQIKQ